VLRAQTVVHVALQDAVLDEHAASRLVALVVDVDGSTRLQQRRIIDDGTELACHRLTHLAGVVARSFAIEISLEPVPYRLVQKDAAVTGSQHHLELTCWRLASVEHGDRLTRCFGCVPLRSLVVEVGQRHASPASARTLLPFARLLGDGSHSESKERLHVVNDLAVARGEQDFANLLGKARLGFDDRSVESVRRSARSLEQLTFDLAWRVDGG
jgi:hypothetical protein